MKYLQIKKKLARIILGIVYPIITFTLGLGFFIAGYSDLPNRITVHFDITRVPTTSLSTPIFGVLMTAILVTAALACIFVAISQKPIHHNIAGYGGFFSSVTAALMAGAVEIHRGLENWFDAVGPGWWILLVVFAGFAGGLSAKKLAVKIHELNSTVCEQTKK